MYSSQLRRLGVLIVGLATSGLVGAAAPADRGVPARPVFASTRLAIVAPEPNNCFYCMMCSESAGHMTPQGAMDGVQGGHACFVGTIYCAWQEHPSCSLQGTALPTRIEEYMTLAAAAGRGSTTAVAKLLLEYADQVTFNAERQSLQLVGCTPETRNGNIPLNVRQVAMLKLNGSVQLASK